MDDGILFFSSVLLVKHRNIRIHLRTLLKQHSLRLYKNSTTVLLKNTRANHSKLALLYTTTLKKFAILLRLSFHSFSEKHFKIISSARLKGNEVFYFSIQFWFASLSILGGISMEISLGSLLMVSFIEGLTI